MSWIPTSNKQVRSHFPELLNDGGFTLSVLTPPAESSNTHSLGDIVLSHPEGPATSDGAPPFLYGIVVSTPVPDVHPHYRVEWDNGTHSDLPASALFDPSECEAHELPPSDPDDDPSLDPSQRDPFHPLPPPWLKAGQKLGFYRNGERLLGTLEISEQHRWVFAQHDTTGRRVLEIELPNLASTWRDLIDDGVLELGHHTQSSPLLRRVGDPEHPMTGSLGDTTRGSLRSGSLFRGHARHVSAKGLSKPYPRFIWQALKDKSHPDYSTWLASYDEENQGLLSQFTYDVINEAEYQRLRDRYGIKAIPTMCILTVKPDSNGQPLRAKSRTVVLGNHEDRYWEKSDLYAPVISKQSVRVMVARAVATGRTAKQCDAKNAFCQPTLPEDEVCVCIPPKGCPYSAPGTYWRLKKTLYGLRRSPRHWYQTFQKALQDIGLTPCTHDPCVFIGRSPTGGTIHFGTYVDDCIYFGSDDASEAWLERELKSRLTIDFMGELSYYLGVHYEWGHTSDGRLTVHCSQEGYIYKMLDQFNLTDAHGVPSPYRSGHLIDRNTHDGQPPEAKPQLLSDYRSIVGGLNWLSLSTRPDITAATSLLATYLQNPSPGHLDSAKHILRYLKGTVDWGLRFTQPPPNASVDNFDPEDCMRGIISWPTDATPCLGVHDRLDTYTDSNWGPQDASRPKPGETRTDAEMYSLIGALVTYMGGPLIWSSERELRASRSVCESEIKGMDAGTRHILGLRHLLADLDVPHLTAPTPVIYTDNQGGVKWAHSPAITKKLRHVNLKEVAVRDSIRCGEISLYHMPGKLNPADIFTKELKDIAHFKRVRAALMSPRFPMAMGARGVLENALQAH